MRKSTFVRSLILAASCTVLLNGCDNSNNEAPYISWQQTKPQQQVSAPANNNPNAASTVWQSMSQKFVLDHEALRPQVMREIKKYQAHQGSLYQILKTGAPYIYYVYQQTLKKNLPAEMALLPVIESEFDPKARSYVGAIGLWQLMPATAKSLGVKINAAYDGRRDIVASTDAALNYLNDLRGIFKSDWNLAIAAYNCGQGKVLSVKKGKRSWFGQSMFWSLPLPQQTREYVPKLLALAAIIQNPQKYGIKLPPIENAPKLATVKVDSKVDLAKTAQTAGVSLQTIKELNPGFNSTKLTAKGSYHIVVPVEKAGNFVNNNQEVNIVSHSNQGPALLPKAATQVEAPATPVHTDQVLLVLLNKQTYEKLMLTSIAWLSHTLPNEQANTTLAQNTDAPAVENKTAAPKASVPIIYYVQNNDSIDKIAQRYQVTVANLQQWNHLTGTQLQYGEKLIIYT